MVRAVLSIDPLANVWERALRFDETLTPTSARALLKLQFSETDTERMRSLSAKARAGTLSAADERMMYVYEQLGCLFDILHPKARRVLKHRRVAS